MVSVIVPVRNEAKQLIHTLDALRLQQNDFKIPLDPELYEVLLLANNCSDNSFMIAQLYKKKYPSFRLFVAEIRLAEPVANIGTVRCLLMDEACARLNSIGNRKGIIASTDGDSEVDPTWIYHIIQEIRKGNDAVGGRIITKHYNDHSCKYYMQNEQYRNLVAKAESIADPVEHDPWPRHFQYFGANLAVTCKMYQKVGGIPQLPWLEDEAFYKALVQKDAKIRKSLKVKVTTSDRQDGRVAIGFAQQLREWAIMKKTNKPQLVPSAEELIIKFKCRQKLRTCWSSQINYMEFNQQRVKQIADNLIIDREWLFKELKRSTYFGKLWEKVEVQMCSGNWGKMWQPVRISKAIKALKIYTAEAPLAAQKA